MGDLLAHIKDRRELVKLQGSYKQFPHLREKFELQMWALYGMLCWSEDHKDGHPGWTEGLLRIAEHEESPQAYADSVISFLRDPRNYGPSDE